MGAGLSPLCRPGAEGHSLVAGKWRSLASNRLLDGLCCQTYSPEQAAPKLWVGCLSAARADNLLGVGAGVGAQAPIVPSTQRCGVRSNGGGMHPHQQMEPPALTPDSHSHGYTAAGENSCLI